MKHLSISVDAMGMGRIEVDGVDISSAVQGFEIKAVAGQPVDVTLRLPPSAISLNASGEARGILCQLEVAQRVGDQRGFKSY